MHYCLRWGGALADNGERWHGWMWSISGMIVIGENRKTRRTACPGATLSIINPTWIALGVNAYLRREKAATSRLSYGTAMLHTYMLTYMCTHIHTHMHTHIIFHKYVHAYMHTYIHTYTHAYIHIYIRTYVRTHTHTHIYIHTHIIRTYIHTYIFQICRENVKNKQSTRLLLNTRRPISCCT
jgi:hypothetical protein